MYAGTYLVGSTVRLTLRVSNPGTQEPVSPASVTLVSLARPDATPWPLTGLVFTMLDPGYFVLALATADLPPGAYTWRSRLADGPDSITLVEDTFTLLAPVT